MGAEETTDAARAVHCAPMREGRAQRDKDITWKERCDFLNKAMPCTERRFLLRRRDVKSLTHEVCHRNPLGVRLNLRDKPKRIGMFSVHAIYSLNIEPE